MLGGSLHPLPLDISRCPMMFLVVTPSGWGAGEAVYYWHLLYLYQGQNTTFKSWCPSTMQNNSERGFLSLGCINSKVSSRREHPKKHKCKTHTCTPKREAFQLDFKSYGLQDHQGRAVGVAVTFPEVVAIAEGQQDALPDPPLEMFLCKQAQHS